MMADETDYAAQASKLPLDEVVRKGESLAAGLLARFDAPERSLTEMREMTVELRQLLLVVRRKADDILSLDDLEHVLGVDLLPATHGREHAIVASIDALRESHTPGTVTKFVGKSGEDS